MRHSILIGPTRQLLRPQLSSQTILVPLRVSGQRAQSTTPKTPNPPPSPAAATAATAAPPAPVPQTSPPTAPTANFFDGSGPEDTEAEARRVARDRAIETVRGLLPEPGGKKRQPRDPAEGTADGGLRFPRSVQALYLQPLRRVPEYGIPTCDLQLRSYSVRNLEFFADFALRAAYYLELPAFGAHPLPRITEKWTVPKSHFIFKKIQENFMRTTHRRLIQIKDGHPKGVKVWLAFLSKHQYHGVGLKANVWEWSELDVAGAMDRSADAAKSKIDKTWAHLGETKQPKTADKVAELLSLEKFRMGGGL